MANNFLSLDLGEEYDVSQPDDEFSDVAMAGMSDPWGAAGVAWGAGDMPGFLSFGDLEYMHPELEGGYYAKDRINPNLINTGRPTTAQERDWILGYMEEKGRLPSTHEAGQWKAGQGFGEYDPLGTRGAPSFDYLPGSTMHGLGFETTREADLARYYGLDRGPRLGETPFNYGLTPIVRGGQTIGYAEDEALRGVAGSMVGGERIPGAPGGAAFEQPNMQELVDKELNPLSQYAYRFDDYINSQKEQELSQLEQHTFTDSKGMPISPEVAQIQREQLASEIDAKWEEERARGIKAAQAGTSVEQLPFYQESLNQWGGLTNWYNQRIAEGKQLDLESKAAADRLNAQQRPQAEPQGDPGAQFEAYVQSLNLAQPAVQWLQNNYFNLERRWRGSGNPHFGNWLGSYLASGGRQ